MTIVHYYKYYVFWHYPSSCLYLKTILFIFQNTTSPEIGISSIDWSQLNRFYLKTETESSLRNVVIWKKKQEGFLKYVHRQDDG
jgi:hypothetical protein